MTVLDARPGLFRRKSTWIAITGLALVTGVALGVAFGWRAAVARSLLSARCEPLPIVDLSVDELVDLKLRWKAYRRDSAPDARFELSPHEAAFLLSGESPTAVHLQGKGDRLVARLAVPTPGGCYNVEFHGAVHIDRGVARLDPDMLVVGGVDIADLGSLGGALGGTRKVILPEDIEDLEVRERLRNVELLTIEGGRVFLRFIEPDRVWR